MKFSYSKRLGKYIASELGNIIDSDDSLDALLTRHGILEEDEPLTPTPADANEANNSDDDDDLAVIRKLLGD